MNERIQELAYEAEDYADSIVDQGGDFHPAYTQKFAELLIRECMDIISDESEKVSDEWRCKDGKHIWWKIKEHFGVEESQGWVCPKCGTDRTKDACPKGHSAALTGDCPMYGVAHGVEK